jgi:transposase-like protein
LVKEDVRLRLHAVKQHLEKGVGAAEIRQHFGVSERTLWYWRRNYRVEAIEGLRNERDSVRERPSTPGKLRSVMPRLPSLFRNLSAYRTL